LDGFFREACNPPNGKGNSFPEASFLYEFLMKSSGLLRAVAPIFSQAAARLGNRAARNALDTAIVLRI
jgi:hypothetical protein